MAAFVLLVRPLIFGLQALLLNNAILPNFGTLIRWRSHGHVLRQSVGWFENDFAGRIANRVMQAPSGGGRRRLPDLRRHGLRGRLHRRRRDPALGRRPAAPDPAGALARALRRPGASGRCAASAPPPRPPPRRAATVTGRVVDAYTNIHSVKMFAQSDRELDYARERHGAHPRHLPARDAALHDHGHLADGPERRPDRRRRRLGDLALVGGRGLGRRGRRRLGAGAAALEHVGLDHDGACPSSSSALGIVRRGDGDASPSPSPCSTRRRPVRSASPRAGSRCGICPTTTAGAAAASTTSTWRSRPRQKVGLVGRSGAGKSTLVKLLLRFYDAEAGRHPASTARSIRDVTQDSLRAAIGMVQQDSSLLHRSVRENILYGRPDASEAEMVAAARQAEAHDFILRLEDSDGQQGLRRPGRRAGREALGRPAPADRARPRDPQGRADPASSTRRPPRSTPRSRRRSRTRSPP